MDFRPAKFSKSMMMCPRGRHQHRQAAVKLPFYFSSYAASAARAANVARVFGGCFLKHVQQQVDYFARSLISFARHLLPRWPLVATTQQQADIESPAAPIISSLQAARSSAGQPALASHQQISLLTDVEESDEEVDTVAPAAVVEVEVVPVEAAEAAVEAVPVEVDEVKVEVPAAVQDLPAAAVVPVIAVKHTVAAAAAAGRTATATAPAAGMFAAAAAPPAVKALRVPSHLTMAASRDMTMTSSATALVSEIAVRRTGVPQQPMLEPRQQAAAATCSFQAQATLSSSSSSSSASSSALPGPDVSCCQRSVQRGTLVLSTAAAAGGKCGKRGSRVAGAVDHVKSVVLRKEVTLRLSESLRDLLVHAAHGDSAAWVAALLLFPADFFTELERYQAEQSRQATTMATADGAAAVGVQPMLGWHVECLQEQHLEYVRLVMYLPWVNGGIPEDHPLLA